MLLERGLKLPLCSLLLACRAPQLGGAVSRARRVERVEALEERLVAVGCGVVVGDRIDVVGEEGAWLGIGIGIGIRIGLGLGLGLG